MEIIFGTQKLTINYHTATREQFYDSNTDTYTTASIGDLGTGVTDLNQAKNRLGDNTLLRHYLGDGIHDNLQVTDGDMNVILDLI